MTLLAFIGWAWLTLGVVCIVVFRFYIGIDHDTIKEEFGEIGNIKIKTPIPYYYFMMLLVGAVVLGYIIYEELKNRY